MNKTLIMVMAIIGCMMVGSFGLGVCTGLAKKSDDWKDARKDLGLAHLALMAEAETLVALVATDEIKFQPDLPFGQPMLLKPRMSQVRSYRF